MNKENILENKIKSVFRDYDSSFTVDLEEEDIDDGDHYYAVLIDYQFGQWSKTHSFELPMRVNEDDSCEYNVYEDVWESLTPENLLMWMFLTQSSMIEEKKE